MCCYWNRNCLWHTLLSLIRRLYFFYLIIVIYLVTSFFFSYGPLQDDLEVHFSGFKTEHYHNLSELVQENIGGQVRLTFLLIVIFKCIWMPRDVWFPLDKFLDFISGLCWTLNQHVFVLSFLPGKKIWSIAALWHIWWLLKYFSFPGML